MSIQKIFNTGPNPFEGAYAEAKSPTSHPTQPNLPSIIIQSINAVIIDPTRLPDHSINKTNELFNKILDKPTEVSSPQKRCISQNATQSASKRQKLNEMPPICEPPLPLQESVEHSLNNDCDFLRNSLDQEENARILQGEGFQVGKQVSLNDRIIECLHHHLNGKTIQNLCQKIDEDLLNKNINDDTVKNIFTLHSLLKETPELEDEGIVFLCNSLVKLAVEKPELAKECYTKALQWRPNRSIYLERNILVRFAKILREEGDFAAESEQLQRLHGISSDWKIDQVLKLKNLNQYKNIPQTWKGATEYFLLKKSNDDTAACNLAILYDNQRALASNTADRQSFRKKAMTLYQEFSRYTPSSHPGSREALYNLLFLKSLNENGCFAPLNNQDVLKELRQQRASNKENSKIPLTQALVSFLMEKKISIIRKFLEVSAQLGNCLSKDLKDLDENNLKKELSKLINNPHAIYISTEL